MNEDNTNENVPVNESQTPEPAPIATPALQPMSQNIVKDLAMPVAIVIAGAFVGLGFFFSGMGSGTPAAQVPTNAPNGAEQAQDTTDAVNPVTEEDHIKGSINAPVKIVEYSDFECPFCKQFHATVQQVVDKYGADQVAWVYRQFPLDSLHRKARPAAMASECVASLGGNDAFWTFTDGYFANTLTNDRTDIETLIPQLVTQAGVNRAAFTTCFEGNEFTAEIDADIQNAIATGGRGTPWTVVIGPDGSTYPVNGAQQFAALDALIGSLLE